MVRHGIALIALVVAVTAPVGAAEARPIVASVAGMAISKASFDHWMRAAATSLGRPAGGDLIPHRYSPRWKHLRDEVMLFLITAKWIVAEAQRLGIDVTDSAVERQYTRDRDYGFRSRREFQQFLRDSGLTTADIRYRVRIDVLSNRIRRKVVAPYKTAAAQQRAFVKFLAGFDARWHAATSCGGPYWVPSCSRALGEA